MSHNDAKFTKGFVLNEDDPIAPNCLGVGWYYTEYDDRADQDVVTFGKKPCMELSVRNKYLIAIENKYVELNRVEALELVNAILGMIAEERDGE